MFDLQRLFGRAEKDRIAKLVGMDRKAFEEFEEAYKASAIDGAFGPSAKAAINESRTVSVEDMANWRTAMPETLLLCDRIVEELTAKHFTLPAPTALVTNQELNTIPEALRPQLTGSLMKVHIEVPSYEILLSTLQRCMKAQDPQKAKHLYGMFRQGLDILDLDPICYEMLGRNPNTMGYWFPALKAAVDKQDFFKVPETRIIKVPMPILQLSRIDFGELTLATKYIVDEFCMKAFDLDVTKTYFIKTGVFSSKFDFRNVRVEGEREVRELGEYLLYISNLACTLAGPLTQPSMYGAATTNEWVVREFIEDKENNPCIYHGLPLHTEYRVFIDCDTDEVLGISPYWRPDVMKKRFEEGPDRNTPDMTHDYIVYSAHEPVLMGRYDAHKDVVCERVADMLPYLNLPGQWSLDIMQNGDEFWCIDMATANTSALNDVVPADKLLRDPVPIQCFLPGGSANCQ